MPRPYKPALYINQPAVIEQMTYFSNNDYTVRVWSDCKNLEDDLPVNVRRKIQEVFSLNLKPRDMAMSILQLDIVSAVEIINMNKCGIVLYKDWP